MSKKINRQNEGISITIILKCGEKYGGENKKE
jgi:hypothetical protein